MNRKAILRRWGLMLPVALGVLLSLPSLNTGLLLDDFWHRELLTSELTQSPPKSASPGLFAFATGNVEQNHALMERGFLPWWSAASLRVSFWRPLAELTHRLDYRLWPDSPLLMHAHNVLWYAGLLVLLGVLFRRLDEDPARASLALLLYATTSAHGAALAWIANRNGIITACFGVLTLLAFHQFRVDGRARALATALGFFALGLLAGEGAIATLGYLVAYELSLSRAPLRNRLLALAPFVLVVVAWKAAYVTLGYGSFASGRYIEPLADPVRFAVAVVSRLPIFVWAQLSGVPAALFDSVPNQALYWALALALGLGFALFVRKTSLWRHGLVRFYVVGTLLSLIPACATAPDDRLLLFANIGGSGLLGTLVYELLTKLRAQRASVGPGARVMLGALLLVHLVLMPIAFPINSVSFARIADALTELPALTLGQADLAANTQMILVNPPVAAFASYMPSIRTSHGLANPEAMLTLATGSRPIELARIDLHTLELTVEGGFIDRGDSAYRTSTLAFRVGEQVDLGAMQAEVMHLTDDGRPRVVRFRFAQPLHADTLRFYAWRGSVLGRLELPPPGASLQLEAVDLAAVLDASS